MSKASPFLFNQGAGHSERFHLPDLRRPSRAHDVRNLRVSLKQWRMLHAVVDCGGYSDAARHLHPSQSAISYTIAKLQEQLGVALLRIEGRKAHLTEAGRLLLDRSRYLIREAIELEQLAEKLRHGTATELQLLVDHDFPKPILMRALRTVAHPGSNSRVCLNEVNLAQAEKALRERTAELAITSELPAGFLGDPLLSVEYVAVAHPTHPLSRQARTLSSSDLTQKTQIVIAIHKEQESKRHAGKQAQLWQVSSLDTALLALKEGLGYAWLPLYLVQPYLERGELLRLPLANRSSYRKNFYLIHGHGCSHDPAVVLLADAVRQAAQADMQAVTTDALPLQQLSS